MVCLTAPIVNMSGYKHSLYAASFQAIGQPIELPQSGGWILKRKINETGLYDAMGCYPLFCCQNWCSLKQDFQALNEDILTLAVVTDPFGRYQYEDLRDTFNHTAKAYKEHFVIDLSQNPASFISKHHQRNVRKASKNVQVVLGSPPVRYSETWIKLYRRLIQRHDIQGIAAFSARSLTDQLAVPGIKLFYAVEGQSIVGIMLWYVQREVAYYHLAAYSDRGYDLKASFALFQHSIEYFSEKGLCWLSLGAGAGVKGDTTDGLTRFKSGWSTGTRMAYFCGHVFDQKKYAECLQAKDLKEGEFFPAYRK